MVIEIDEIFVGVDISKDSFETAIKDFEKNLLVKTSSYKQDLHGMENFINNMETTKNVMKADILIGMEATGIYHLALYNELGKRGYKVRIFNALELVKYHKGKIRKTKTDKIDAELIADALIYEGYKPLKENTPKDIATLREYCRIRERIIRKLSICKVQAIRNLDTVLRGYDKVFDDTFCKTSKHVLKKHLKIGGIKVPVKDEMIKLLNKYMNMAKAKDKANKICNTFQNVLIVDHLIKPDIYELYFLMDQMELLEKQLTRIQKKLEKALSSTKSKIVTIPGVGIVTGATILSEIGNINNFDSPTKLVAFAGLDPTVKQSGKFKANNTNISKRGSPALREALYLAAFGSLKSNPACKAVYDRMIARGKHFKVAMCATARKLLHIIYSVLKNNKEFFVPEYLMVNAKPR